MGERGGELVLGYTDGAVSVAQGIFCHDPILVLTEKESNGRGILCRAHLFVNSGDIETQLPEMLRFEVCCFQFNDHVAVQSDMVE